MSDGYPSMTALLGLLAVAGFQNRDKIAGWLGSHAGQPAGAAPAGSAVPPAGGPMPSGLSGVLGNLSGKSDVGSFLGNGLNDLFERFQQSGHGSVANSWVQTGPNQAIGPQQMEQAIGSDTLDSLTKQTGFTREELLARLSRELPQAVDHYTPNGQLPPRG